MGSSIAAKPQAFRHAKRAAWRKVADEAVILDTETAAYYSLDGAGMRLWELLGEGRSLDAAAAELAEEFDAPEETIRRDCEALLRELRKEKLVEPA